MSLSLQFLSALTHYAFLNEIYQPEGHFYGVDLCKAYPPNFKTGVYVLVSTDSFFNQFKTSRMH